MVDDKKRRPICLESRVLERLNGAFGRNSTPFTDTSDDGFRETIAVVGLVRMKRIPEPIRGMALASNRVQYTVSMYAALAESDKRTKPFLPSFLLSAAFESSKEQGELQHQLTGQFRHWSDSLIHGQADGERADGVDGEIPNRNGSDARLTESDRV